ncbi:MAG: hypothetical protein PHD82_16980, partial [Candidatus Riflebacteria bacterium]|nr:hypothetical protein [Candidatus Riflebacteria bacterium]
MLLLKIPSGRQFPRKGLKNKAIKILKAKKQHALVKHCVSHFIIIKKRNNFTFFNDKFFHIFN